MAWGLHHKAECDGSLFKEVNSRVKPVARVVHSALLTFRSWSGVLDMIVVPMDNQKVILGQDFLRLARAIPVPHEECLLFEDRTKTFGCR